MLEKPTIEETFSMMKRHAGMLVAKNGEMAGMRKMRSHAAWYVAGFKGAASLRKRLGLVSTMSELDGILEGASQEGK